MVKRIVVGAHYGLRGWLVQRVSAVVMAVYTVLLIAILFMQPVLDYAIWAGLFENQWIRLATLLFLSSLLLHAWVGMRDILMDYIQHTGARLALEILTVLALTLYALWSLEILWGAG